MKKKMKVMNKTSIENSMDMIHIESQKLGVCAYNGTGVHKNRKYDKKLRRKEGKQICRDEY